MRRIYGLLLLAGMLLVLTLSGCSSTANTTTQTSQLGAATAAATTTGVAPTVAAATATPPSHTTATHTPTQTGTPASTTENCGSITATTTGTTTTTTPSNPQPLEDCFTNAFVACQPASLAITFIDSTGKTLDGLKTPDPQGGCEVASVDETKLASNGSITSTSFTCMALVPYSGVKYSLRECSNNEFFSLP
jgi:hypothetical protein